MKRVAKGLAAFVLVACKGSTTTEASPAPPPPSSVPARTAPEPPDAASVATATPIGDWERVTEPYKGMVIRIRASGDVLEGAVLTPSPRTETPQLACQASLWKAGEHYLRLQENKGSIVVRDWGLTAGVCRHADAKGNASARLESEELVLEVTRGAGGGAKTPVAQRWRRRAP